MTKSPDKRKAAKIVAMSCVVGALVCFFFGVSFYYRDLPSHPQPELGRLYPLNNHGFVMYMTKQEKTQQQTAFIAFGVLAAVAVVLELLFDVSDRRSWDRFRRLTRPTWNRKWGPD